MPIYTRSGDRGETGLVGGSRIGKDAARIEAIGAVDELNAALGVVRALCLTSSGNTSEVNRAIDTSEVQEELELNDWLTTIQRSCFSIGAELASPDGANQRISESDVVALEQTIDGWQQTLPKLTQFILPGGSLVAAQLHLARAVSRRAERAVVALHRDEPVRPVLLRWLNRLSDALFVAARWVNYQSGMTEEVWKSKAR